MAWKIIFAILLSWFVGQTIKFLLTWNQYHKPNVWVYFQDGGMPSTHAAMAVALSTAIFFESGISSLFVIVAFFTVIMVSDSMKVKKIEGMHSDVLSRFVDVREILRRKLTESLGHTPEQVAVGAIIGFVVAGSFYLI